MYKVDTMCAAIICSVSFSAELRNCHCAAAANKSSPSGTCITIIGAHDLYRGPTFFPLPKSVIKFTSSILYAAAAAAKYVLQIAVAFSPSAFADGAVSVRLVKEQELFLAVPANAFAMLSK